MLSSNEKVHKFTNWVWKHSREMLQWHWDLDSIWFAQDNLFKVLQGFANCSWDPEQSSSDPSKGTFESDENGKREFEKVRASEKWLTNLCSGMANTIVYARYFVKELNKTAHLYKHVTDLPLAPLPNEHAGRWEWVFSSFRSLPEDAAKVLACKSTKYKALKRVDRSWQCAVLILKILIDILCLARQD